MKEIFFQYGSRAQGWKRYSCHEKETAWDKERLSMFGIEGNMLHWTEPKEVINIGRKKSIELDFPNYGMAFSKCNFRKLCKRLNRIMKSMPEENFPDEDSKITYYWELTFRYDKGFKMWRGINYDPIGLQEVKECFANYFKNK